LEVTTAKLGARARLARDIRAGAIVGATTLLNACAYATFLAGGPLAPLLPAILAALLIATAIVSLVLARAYSLPSAMGGPAGNAAAVVGAAVAIAAHDPTGLQRSADVTVILALTALLPGVVMLALAAAKLGRAIRYFPYPVVAGFLAGTGWLLVVGAVRMAGPPGPLVLGLACTIGLRVAFARWKSPLAFPLAALAAIAGTWIALFVWRIPADAAREQGWLFTRLPAALPALLTPETIRSAHWGAIANDWGPLAWVVIVVVAVSMLNGALLELETGIDERVDRDLFAMGTANIIAGLAGGFGSQLVLPTSLAASKLAPGSRSPGYVVAVVALCGAVGSAAVLPYLPRPIFAAIIAFYGIRFIEQYIRDASRAMNRTEIAIAVAMLAATALLGLETALFVGLALACIAFVSAASRFPVVRRETTLGQARSRVERTARERAILDVHGDAVPVVRLQGHLFFGSASTIDAALRPLVDREPPPAAIVFDFTLVEGVDVSAALGFAKLARRARRRGTECAFARVTPAIERALRGNGALGADERAHPTLDAALEAHEDRLLAGTAFWEPAMDGHADEDVGRGFADALRPFVETLALRDGERLFSAGDEANALYVLTAGRLAVENEGVRLRTLLAGALVGEMGFYTGAARSADVVALGNVEVERLTREAFARLERDAPSLLGAFQRAIVRLQADRLRSANAETIAFHI
jgi:SulP family sulfate permease